MLDVAIQSKSYRTAKGAPLKAIDSIAFQVSDGEFACLVGPSGCGKTTTLRLILGLDREFDGRIRTPPGRVAAMFQEPRLLPWRTVEENIRLVLPPELAADDLSALFEMVGPSGMERLYPGELSLGMARRAALARAFAVKPSLLVLDEPFVSLDAATAIRMRRLLMEVWSARPTTVLMVTHNLAEAAELADRIILVSERPGSVRAIHEITLPRERRGAAAVAEIVAEIAGRWPAEQ